MIDALIWLDVTLWRWVTFGRYPMGETASSAAYRMKRAGRRRGRVAVWLIDAIFRIGGEINHCESAYQGQRHIYKGTQ